MMSFMRTFIVFAALALGGCGYRSAAEFRLSSSLLPEQQADFIEAAEDLFAAVPGSRVPISIVADSEANVSPNLTRKMQAHCDTGAAATTRINSFEEPLISPCPGFDFRGDEFRRAMAHEIIHALTGTDDHIEQEGNVMSLDLFDTPARLTADDVAFFERRR